MTIIRREREKRGQIAVGDLVETDVTCTGLAALRAVVDGRECGLTTHTCARGLQCVCSAAFWDHEGFPS